VVTKIEVFDQKEYPFFPQTFDSCRRELLKKERKKMIFLQIWCVGETTTWNIRRSKEGFNLKSGNWINCALWFDFG